MPVSNVFGPLTAANGFVDPWSDTEDRVKAAVLYGLFMGVSGAVLVQMLRQLHLGEKPYFTSFKVLVCLMWLAMVPFGTIEWCRFEHRINPSFPYYFFDILLWAIQTQCLTQIVANRVGILVNNRRTRIYVKVGVAIWISILDIMCFCSWGAVALQTENMTFYKLLIPFNIAIMTGIMACDIGLNMWFVYTVRKRLSNLGLRKYNRLVYVNLALLGCSVGLDATIVGLMFMTNKSLYLMIYPFAYAIKLAIELSLSSIIVKIASESPVKRVNKETLSSNADLLSDAIHIKTEIAFQAAKDEPVHIVPSFGQNIRRPEPPYVQDEMVYLPQTDYSEKGDSSSLASDSKSYV